MRDGRLAVQVRHLAGAHGMGALKERLISKGQWVGVGVQSGKSVVLGGCRQPGRRVTSRTGAIKRSG